jgi:hypothetical protein
VHWPRDAVPTSSSTRQSTRHGVSAAFDALGDPETHAKILIDPKSAAVAP